MTPKIHPHEIEAIRALVNLHDPDTQPDEWQPEDHAAAKARQEEITQAEPARPEAVREILATTRRHRTGATT